MDLKDLSIESQRLKIDEGRRKNVEGMKSELI
jgi:hypothetical protein